MDNLIKKYLGEAKYKVEGPGSFDNSMKRKWVITKDGEIISGKPKGYRSTGTPITYDSKESAEKALKRMK